MANPKKQRKGGGNTNTNWTPYFVALGVVAVVIGVYGNLVKNYISPPPPKAKIKSVLTSESQQKSVEELEAQIKTMAVTLGQLAQTGKTGVFQKIGAMAEEAEQWLAAAKAQTSEEKKREILEQGIAQKSKWIGVLGDHSTKLQQEEEEGKQGASPGHAVHLTEKSFSQFIGSNPYAIVEFYAPWCGHCKKLAPEYDKAAQHFQGRVGFGAVEATTETMLARVYSISRYPTLKWFVKGQVLEYPTTKEGLTAAALTKWIEDRLQPAFVEVDDAGELMEAMDAAGTGSTGIVVCEAQKDSDLHKAFVAASELKRNKMVFAFVSAKDDAENSIKLFKGSKDSVKCEGPSCATNEGLISWLEQNLDNTATSSTTTAIPFGETEELD